MSGRRAALLLLDCHTLAGLGGAAAADFSSRFAAPVESTVATLQYVHQVTSMSSSEDSMSRQATSAFDVTPGNVRAHVVVAPTVPDVRIRPRAAHSPARSGQEVPAPIGDRVAVIGS